MIPVKISNREYVCAICKHKGFNRFEIETTAGNIKRKCWACMSPKEKQAYNENKPKPKEYSECPDCGAGIVKINGTVPCCKACIKPVGLCRCERLVTVEEKPLDIPKGYPYKIIPAIREEKAQSRNRLRLEFFDPMERCRLKPDSEAARWTAENRPFHLSECWSWFGYCSGGASSCAECATARKIKIS